MISFNDRSFDIKMMLLGGGGTIFGRQAWMVLFLWSLIFTAPSYVEMLLEKFIGLRPFCENKCLSYYYAIKWRLVDSHLSWLWYVKSRPPFLHLIPRVL